VNRRIIVTAIPALIILSGLLALIVFIADALAGIG